MLNTVRVASTEKDSTSAPQVGGCWSFECSQVVGSAADGRNIDIKSA